MIRPILRSGLMAAIVCSTILALSASAQDKPPHPLEGLYEVSANRTDKGQGFNFLVSLKRDGGKWVGAVSETPVPVTVKEVTIDGENSLTGSATIDAGGNPISITVKFDGSKITCNATDGDKAITITGEKKATGGKATVTIEGTYAGQASAVDGNSFPIEIILKRAKSSDK